MTGIVYRQCHIHRNEHGQCLLRADSFTCSRDLGVLDKSTGFFFHVVIVPPVIMRLRFTSHTTKKEYSVLQVISIHH